MAEQENGKFFEQMENFNEMVFNRDIWCACRLFWNYYKYGKYIHSKKKQATAMLELSVQNLNHG